MTLPVPGQTATRELRKAPVGAAGFSAALVTTALRLREAVAAESRSTARLNPSIGVGLKGALLFYSTRLQTTRGLPGETKATASSSAVQCGWRDSVTRDEESGRIAVVQESNDRIFPAASQRRHLTAVVTSYRVPKLIRPRAANCVMNGAAVATAVCLCIWVAVVAEARELSFATRREDVAYLEELTRPFRQELHAGGEPFLGLVDFLASAHGAAYLTGHANALGDPTTLEEDYDRETLCTNARDAENRGSLTEASAEYKDCLCSNDLPFLHCLAQGTQMLRDDGLLNADLTPLEIRESLDQGSTNQEEEAGCVPYPFRRTDTGTLVLVGECLINIAKLYAIRIETIVSLGASSVSHLDLERCAVCSGITSSENCQPVCKDNIEEVEMLVDYGYFRNAYELCWDLGWLGTLMETLYGRNRCVSSFAANTYPYQRVIDLDFRIGPGNWRAIGQVLYKFESGPECTCQLATFFCTTACGMEAGHLLGSAGFEWDFFFAEGSYVADFKLRKKCYTEHPHPPDDCPAQPT